MKSFLVALLVCAVVASVSASAARTPANTAHARRDHLKIIWHPGGPVPDAIKKVRREAFAAIPGAPKFAELSKAKDLGDRVVVQFLANIPSVENQQQTTIPCSAVVHNRWTELVFDPSKDLACVQNNWWIPNIPPQKN